MHIEKSVYIIEYQNWNNIEISLNCFSEYIRVYHGLSDINFILRLCNNWLSVPILIISPIQLDHVDKKLLQLSIKYILVVTRSNFKTIIEPRHQNTTNVAVGHVKTQISLGIISAWSESSLSTWRMFGSIVTHYPLWSDWRMSLSCTPFTDIWDFTLG